MVKKENKNWSKNLSIGNSEIDREHSALYEIYMELHDFVLSSGNREEFAKILSRMTDYSLIHFKKEEEYLKRMEYPKFREHKNYHMNYIYKVAMYNVEFMSENPPDSNEIIQFIEKWWCNHILIKDIEYENYKKEYNSDISY